MNHNKGDMQQNMTLAELFSALVGCPAAVTRLSLSCLTPSLGSELLRKFSPTAGANAGDSQMALDHWRLSVSWLGAATQLSGMKT